MNSTVMRLDTLDRRLAALSYDVCRQRDDIQTIKDVVVRACDMLCGLCPIVDDLKKGLVSLKDNVRSFSNTLVQYLEPQHVV